MRKMYRDSISALQTRSSILADAGAGHGAGVEADTSKKGAKIFQRCVRGWMAAGHLTFVERETVLCCFITPPSPTAAAASTAGIATRAVVADDYGTAAAAVDDHD